MAGSIGGRIQETVRFGVSIVRGGEDGNSRY